MARDDVIAWVESPLQLIGAAEWAAAHDTRVPVAGRLTPQMSATADELLRRRAPFGELAPYLGIPWRDLSRHGHWLVGDGFSGQFRLAAAVLRPHRVTFLDDGANALAFADTITGARPYARPGIVERGLTVRVAPLTLETLQRRAADGRLELFTAFPLHLSARRRLTDLGAAVCWHAFEWTRSSAPRPTVPEQRIVLGSALPVDGRMPRDDYLAWVAQAAGDGAAYLPHRRETSEQRAAVAAIAGVNVRETGLPVELALAGAAEPLEIHTLPSSAAVTLPLVLAGTGATLHERPSTVGAGR